jgi:hypothetical protein
MNIRDSMATQRAAAARGCGTPRLTPDYIRALEARIEMLDLKLNRVMDLLEKIAPPAS